MLDPFFFHLSSLSVGWAHACCFAVNRALKCPGFSLN